MTDIEKTREFCKTHTKCGGCLALQKGQRYLCSDVNLTIAEQRAKKLAIKRCAETMNKTI